MAKKASRLDPNTVAIGLLVIGVFSGLMPLFRIGTLIGAVRVLATPMATVTGTIVQSEVERFHDKRTTYYSYAISYRYAVNGREYTSNVVSYANVCRGQMDIIQPVLDKYPKGRKVPVYYAPRSPDFAVLEKEPSRNAALFFGSLTVLSVGCLGASFLLNRRMARGENIHLPDASG